MQTTLALDVISLICWFLLLAFTRADSSDSSDSSNSSIDRRTDGRTDRWIDKQTSKAQKSSPVVEPETMAEYELISVLLAPSFEDAPLGSLESHSRSHISACSARREACPLRPDQIHCRLRYPKERRTLCKLARSYGRWLRRNIRS